MARDCKAGDRKNKCDRYGERGHIERHCKNSPKEFRRERSRSRSPSRGRSRSPSYSRSYSRSRSPVRRGRSLERDDRSRSPAGGDPGAPKEFASGDSDDSIDSEENYDRRTKLREDCDPIDSPVRSPSPREDRSPVDEDDYDNRRSP